MRYFIAGFTALGSPYGVVSLFKSFEAPYMPTHKAFIDWTKESNPVLTKITLVSLTELSEDDYNTFLSEI